MIHAVLFHEPAAQRRHAGEEGKEARKASKTNVYECLKVNESNERVKWDQTATLKGDPRQPLFTVFRDFSPAEQWLSPSDLHNFVI